MCVHDYMCLCCEGMYLTAHTDMSAYISKYVHAQYDPTIYPITKFKEEIVWDFCSAERKYI